MGRTVSNRDHGILYYSLDGDANVKEDDRPVVKTLLEVGIAETY